MKKGLVFCIVAVLLLLSGCHHYTNDKVEHNLVKQIIITGQSENETIHRYYDTPDKMRQVLAYIRSVSGSFDAQTDPADTSGRTIRITTVCADDTQKIYQQKDNEYFQVGTGRWQQIDPELGETLWELIRQTPSDAQ